MSADIQILLSPCVRSGRAPREDKRRVTGTVITQLPNMKHKLG
jgi:hypothetical protein